MGDGPWVRLTARPLSSVQPQQYPQGVSPATPAMPTSSPLLGWSVLLGLQGFIDASRAFPTKRIDNKKLGVGGDAVVVPQPGK